VVDVDVLLVDGEAPIELVPPEDDVSLLAEPEEPDDPVLELPMLPLPDEPLPDDGDVLLDELEVPGEVEPVASRLLQALRDSGHQGQRGAGREGRFHWYSLWVWCGNALGKGRHRRPNGTLGSY